MKKYILLLALMIGSAQATEYNAIDVKQSSITFSSKMMGSKVSGSFESFTGHVKFDSANPSTAKGELVIDISSLKAGGDELRDEAMGKAWFNQAAFPKAKFVIEQVKSTGDKKLQITGKLVIKNKTQPLVAFATVNETGNTAVIDANFTLKRLDFALGEGAWADVSSVANEVPVQVHLILKKNK